MNLKVIKDCPYKKNNLLEKHEDYGIIMTDLLEILNN